ncbi:hypothetical protein QBC35DRAFT_393699, partial [Podospora australis]
NIKVLVSSRPIPVCVEAFRTVPRLHLHDLTQRDIAAYVQDVQDVIGNHIYVKDLLKRYSTGTQAILNTLTEKASGVFLWVILACRSLLSGFADCDSVAELQQLVNVLPEELEDMLQRMLVRVKDQHREQGARLMRIFYEEALRQPKSHLESIPLRGLAMMNDDLTRISNHSRFQ